MSTSAVIIKHVVKDKKGRAIPHRFDLLRKYIDDAAHDGGKLRQCPETGAEMTGAVNFYSKNRDAQEAEALDLIACYGGNGKPVRHIVASFEKGKGETLTLASVTEAMQTTLRHLGMENHKCLFSVHENTDNIHIHMALVRVAPEPNEKGKYYIPVEAGTVRSLNEETGERNRNDALCFQAAIHEICLKHGWEIPENLTTDMHGNALHPANPDKDHMAPGTQSGEVRTGIKSRERQIAEFADRVFADAKPGQEQAALDRLNAAGLTYKISWKNGKPVGAVIESHDGIHVKNSRLSKENGFKSLSQKLPGLLRAKNDMEAVATPSIDIYKVQMSQAAAKKLLKPIFEDVKTNREGWDSLSQKLPAGMNLEKSGGGYVVKFNDGADQLKLSQIGREFSASKMNAAFEAPAKAEAKADKAQDYADRAEKSADNAASRAVSAGTDLATAQTMDRALDEAFDAINAAHALRVAQERAVKAEAIAAEAQARLDAMKISTVATAGAAQTAQEAIMNGQAQAPTQPTNAAEALNMKEIPAPTAPLRAGRPDEPHTTTPNQGRFNQLADFYQQNVTWARDRDIAYDLAKSRLEIEEMRAGIVHNLAPRPAPIRETHPDEDRHHDPVKLPRGMSEAAFASALAESRAADQEYRERMAVSATVDFLNGNDGRPHDSVFTHISREDALKVAHDAQDRGVDAALTSYREEKAQAQAADKPAEEQTQAKPDQDRQKAHARAEAQAKERQKEQQRQRAAKAAKSRAKMRHGHRM